MIMLRKSGAVAALLLLATLIVTTVERGPLGADAFAIAMWLLLAPLGLSAIGLIREKPAARWLAMGGAVAVIPWSSVLVATPGFPRGAPEVALGASIGLLVCLGGRTMGARYTPSRLREADSRRRSLIGATIVCNIASILVLYLFVAAYDFRVGWYAGATAVLLIGLLASVLALARGKTAGVLGVVIGCLFLIPSATVFVAHEAAHAGEGLLLMGVLLPGILTSLACAIAFGGPIWRYARG